MDGLKPGEMHVVMASSNTGRSIYAEWVGKSFYAKRGSPDLTFEIVKVEVAKDFESIRSGQHPFIGYIDRNNPKPITDAWWQ